jgi:hypothetical protein
MLAGAAPCSCFELALAGRRMMLATGLTYLGWPPSVANSPRRRAAIWCGYHVSPSTQTSVSGLPVDSAKEFRIPVWFADNHNLGCLPPTLSTG